MLTQAEIANIALGMLGTTYTVSDVPTDNSIQGKVVRVHYERTHRNLLKKYEWGFATVPSVALSLIEENPVEEWAYSYRCPNDCLVIRKLGQKGELRDKDIQQDEVDINRWEEAYDGAGKLILTDVFQAYAKYTKNVPADENMPDHYGEALAGALAINIAPSLITSNYAKVKSLLLSDAQNIISDGWAQDLNLRPRQKTSDSIFIRARMK